MSTPNPSAVRPAQILVVDDEPDLRTLYELTLLREGYRVEAAGSVSEAWQHLEGGHFDAVITDMRLPDGLGMEILHRIQQSQRSERCVVMTAYGSAENAVEALKAGAFDYLTKPVDLKQFRAVVASDVQAHAMAAAARPARPVEGSDKPVIVAATSTTGFAALERLVGDSAPMRLVKSRIAKVARGMAPVLVRGESGTGKELVARAVHACSQRSDGPFVAVNCGAIPENLLEAEFFGARKGSYTGSSQDRDGYFQAARGGTLFLDEIGDLPLAMQSKLLRAIQERSVRPIGSTQEDTVDVRIVSATHKDLHAEVHAGRFRQDLFYRLNVIEIAVPALRERREDLPALCTALLARIAQDGGMPAPTLSPDVIERLGALPLNGNVRELENLLHRAVALNDGDMLHLDFMDSTVMPSGMAELAEARAIPAEAPAGPPAQPNAKAPPAVPEEQASPVVPDAKAPPAVPRDLQSYLDQQEREILVRALQDSGFNRPPPPRDSALACGRSATGSHGWASRRPTTTSRKALQQVIETAFETGASLWRAGLYLPARHLPSPNFGPRPAKANIDLIVIHSISLPPGHFGGNEVQEFFTNRLDCNAHPSFASIRGVKVSAHFYVRRDGEIWQFVSCDDRAWHAGTSTWRGRSNCNDDSIGIELEGLEGQGFEARQYEALSALCPAIAQHYPIAFVAGHEHIAPGRKRDPGSGFDWNGLRQQLDWDPSMFPSSLDLR